MTGPNVVWIVSDHQAFANRSLPPGMFPLQSRLQAIGTAFDRAYTVLPICSPSRATMLTGLYPHAHGLTENDGRFGGRAEIGADDCLVHQSFIKAGYRCGWFGKWHLNYDRSAMDFGFEGFSLSGYGYPYGTAEYRAYLDRFHSGPLWAEVELPGESRRSPGDRVDLTAEDAWFDYEAGTAIIHGQEEVHEAHFLADAAIRWVEELDAAQPFFLRLDPWGPHPPYTLPNGFRSPLGPGDAQPPANLTNDLSDRPSHHRDYRDQWRRDLPDASFDWPLLSRRALEHCILVERALVRLVDHLEAAGRLKDTIIVFCADHGDAVASNGGVMNKGSLMVEETMRIPLIFAGPGIAQGQNSKSLFGNVDLTPTLLDLCGLNPTPQMQGHSARNHLADPHTAGPRERLMVEHYGLHLPILQRGLYMGDWKFVIQPDGFEELYDLSTDPAELNNRASDPQAVENLAMCRHALGEELRVLGDTDQRLDCMRQVLAGPVRMG